MKAIRFRKYSPISRIGASVKPLTAVDRDKYMIDGQVAVNYFIRYEALHQGLETVCRQVGYPFRPERLGRYKGDSRFVGRPYGDYYDRAAVAAVESAFGWELDYFGYRRLSDH